MFRSGRLTQLLVSLPNRPCLCRSHRIEDVSLCQMTEIQVRCCSHYVRRDKFNSRSTTTKTLLTVPSNQFLLVPPNCYSFDHKCLLSLSVVNIKKKISFSRRNVNQKSFLPDLQVLPKLRQEKDDKVTSYFLII